MIVRLVYFFLLALVVRAVWRSLLSHRTVSTPRGVDRPPTVYKGLMVRDPVCGLYLPESRALSLTTGGEALHFCSEECRADYRKAHL